MKEANIVRDCLNIPGLQKTFPDWLIYSAHKWPAAGIFQPEILWSEHQSFDITESKFSFKIPRLFVPTTKN
jgi:hypothetical protein